MRLMQGQWRRRGPADAIVTACPLCQGPWLSCQTVRLAYHLLADPSERHRFSPSQEGSAFQINS